MAARAAVKSGTVERDTCKGRREGDFSLLKNLSLAVTIIRVYIYMFLNER